MNAKRIFCFILSVLLFSITFFSACGAEDGPVQQTTAATQSTPPATDATTITTTEAVNQELSLYDLMTIGATVYNAQGVSTGKTPLEMKKTDFGTVSYGTVLTQESIDALGIANSKMSAQELRELCLNYFKLQLSFLWTPSENVECYPNGSPSLYGKYMQQYAGQETAEFDTNTGKALLEGTIYGGIPYQNVSTGNIYRWMEYYDESTGTMDLLNALVENGTYDNGAWMTQKHEYKRDSNGNLLDKNGQLCSVSGLDPVLSDEDFASTLYTVVYKKPHDVPTE